MGLCPMMSHGLVYSIAVHLPVSLWLVTSKDFDIFPNEKHRLVLKPPIIANTLYILKLSFSKKKCTNWNFKTVQSEDLKLALVPRKTSWEWLKNSTSWDQSRARSGVVECQALVKAAITIRDYRSSWIRVSTPE